MSAQRDMEIKAEADANELVNALVEQLADAAVPIWHWGDGYGGHVKELLRKAIESRGLFFEQREYDRPAPKRKTISRHTRDIVIARDGLKCQYCFAALHPAQITLDHKVALANGGTDDPENLCVACRTCNCSKGARDQQEFQSSR